MSDQKKYSLTLSRAYKTKVGAWSVDLGPEEIAALKQVEAGGRLVYRELREESRKNKTSPHGYFQYMTPAEVKEMKERTAKPKEEELDTVF